jgi:hypothetical protein
VVSSPALGPWHQYRGPFFVCRDRPEDPATNGRPLPRNAAGLERSVTGAIRRCSGKSGGSSEFRDRAAPALFLRSRVGRLSSPKRPSTVNVARARPGGKRLFRRPVNGGCGAVVDHSPMASEAPRMQSGIRRPETKPNPVQFERNHSRRGNYASRMRRDLMSARRLRLFLVGRHKFEKISVEVTEID